MQSIDRAVIDLIRSLVPSFNISTFKHPAWAYQVEFLALLAVMTFLFVNVRKKTSKNAILFFMLLTGLITCECYLLINHALWLQFVFPAVLLLSVYIATFFQHYLNPTQITPEANSNMEERNYTLGLAFLQQGQLDWAFEKFKSCTTSQRLMGSLYLLAEEFETKQQFKKAIDVYQYIYDFDYTFKDVGIKKVNIEQQLLLSMSSKETLRYEAQKKQRNLPRPMLDHYKLTKEIGKGAMGTVYLAHDTKHDRTVAIKTLPLEDEFDETELDAVKKRFFREAETAGQLVHPNIVKVYSLGETARLAYIAMEHLSGQDLARHTHKENLLAPNIVMKIVYKAAKALDYAHSQQVIHRDIKPGNIMFDRQQKKVTLTDFGIARLIDASRTRTGVILGTPAYMSPEQLAGTKIDGRSDLFSLGVMLFQLLTGELPFKGESLAMLMYMITNEPHSDIFSVKPELAQSFPALAAIIDKALEKEAKDRYQSGLALAEALKQCAQ